MEQRYKDLQMIKNPDDYQNQDEVEDEPSDYEEDSEELDKKMLPGIQDP
jgi:hypothetical protein